MKNEFGFIRPASGFGIYLASLGFINAADVDVVAVSAGSMANKGTRESLLSPVVFGV